MEESLKSQALQKMLEEMSKDHTPVEDTIHNWLCGQDDDELFSGILKDGRTIKGAVKHIANLARKQVAGNMTVVDDATVFGWVRDYFTADEVEEPKDLNFEVKTAEEKPAEEKPAVISKPKPKKKKQKAEEDGQLSLFDNLL